MNMLNMVVSFVIAILFTTSLNMVASFYCGLTSPSSCSIAGTGGSLAGAG